LKRTTIIFRPLDNPIEFHIESLRLLYQVVHETRFVPRSRVDQKVKRTPIEGLQGVQEVIATPQIAQLPLVFPQPETQGVPTLSRQLGWTEL
jgi:hypothetical protein